jgi:hypothetical protein
MSSGPIKTGMLHANLLTWLRKLIWRIVACVYSLVTKYTSSVNFTHHVYWALLTNPNPSYLGPTTTEGA